MSDKIYSVAIDGPAGAGKSTIAKRVADILNIEYIDTGAMYRAITLKILKSNEKIIEGESLDRLLASTNLDFKNGKIYLDGVNVNDKIRDNNISKSASHVAKLKSVRTKLLKIQREIAEDKSVVMDGRDIGSVVLPQADYKFFLTASVEVRAKRRFNELINKKEDVSLDDIKNEIKTRDKIDSHRKIAPLKKVEDAILIDSSEQTIDETIDDIMSYIDIN